MSSLASWVAFTFAVAILVASGGCTGQSATNGSPTSTSSSPTPTTTQWMPYTSDQYGYSLKVPAHWTYQAATKDWPQGVYPAGGSPYIDQWALPPGPFPVIDIMTQRLARGMRVSEFMAWLDKQNAKICTVESTDDIVVDGSTGRLQRQTCGYNAYEVAVFDGRRVYLIYWIGGEIEDRTLFEEILSTFRFPP